MCRLDIPELHEHRFFLLFQGVVRNAHFYMHLNRKDFHKFNVGADHPAAVQDRRQEGTLNPFPALEQGMGKCYLD